MTKRLDLPDPENDGIKYMTSTLLLHKDWDYLPCFLRLHVAMLYPLLPVDKQRIDTDQKWLASDQTVSRQV